ncbi:homeodomain-interacting protein kinase 2-like [Centropristis striata]|uniref:homeodomain-interacting protein kinase 2-like n=1 Tax=Centropristis striata TaxID=184440 RepID=UPI0027DEC25A|nr:homeodomain-interacting protein kinase 2-like [Centropristis striata]
MPSSSRSAICLSADKNAVADEQKKSEVFEVKKSDVLCGDTGRYLVKNFIAIGSFGKVAKCVNLNTSQEVALKILKAEDRVATTREMKMLEAVSVLDSDKKNVAQFFEKFEHNGQTCLAFELLDRSLHDLLNDRDCKPLSLIEIRPIAQQLLTAFAALKRIGVVHSDLKADNIMLVNHSAEPFRVKLIDFGVSFYTSEKLRGCSIQPLGYRAPEVTLGLPVCEAIDMWGLGCVLVLLYIGNHAFSIQCEYQGLKAIVEILGQPADHLLSAGYYTKKYFKASQHLENPKWSLKIPEEYQLDTGMKPKGWERSFDSLDGLITLDTEMQESIELEDQREFVSLLKCLLHTDAKERITPEKALKHPFITMSHLEHGINSSLYVEDSFDAMYVCPLDDSEEELPSDDQADERPEDDGPSDRTQTHCEVTPCADDGVTNMPCPNDGAAVVEHTGAAEEEPAERHSADSPAEEEPAVNHSAASPAEEPAVNHSAASPAEEPAVNHSAASPADEEPAMSHNAASQAEEPAVNHSAASPAEEPAVNHSAASPAEEPAVNHSAASPANEEPAMSHNAASQAEEPAVNHSAASQAEEPAMSNNAASQAEEPAVNHSAASQAEEPAVNHSAASPANEEPAMSHNAASQAEEELAEDHVAASQAEEPAVNHSAASQAEEPAVNHSAASQADEEPAMSHNAASQAEEPAVNHSATSLANEEPAMSHNAASQAEEPAVNHSAASQAEEPAVNHSEASPANEEPAMSHNAASQAEEELAEDHVAASQAEEPAVSHGAASPAEETISTDWSPDEAPSLKAKKSRLKTIRKFFGRAIRILFRKKTC